VTPAKARLSGLMFPLLLAAVVWFLVIPHGRDDRRLVRAEFQTAGLLVPGHDVRIAGTTSGTVRDIVLTRRGTALVSFALDEGVPALSRNASASVRDSDLLGGTYLAVEPGSGPAPLHGTIPVTRTFTAPRVQDMFETFDAPTRTALRTLVAELAVAVESRGVELNRAVLELAGALRAGRDVSTQLTSQEAQLDRTIIQLQRLTGTLAPRSRDAERLIDGLDRALATTAARGPDLDRGLARLPRTLDQLDRTLVRLSRTARAVRPVVGDLGAAAPQLATAAHRLGPFSREARAALADVRPFLLETRTVLRRGARSLPRLRRAAAALTQQTPHVAAFATMVRPYVTYLVKGVFAGIGGLAAEPGTQDFSNQPGRNYFRGEGVLGCEAFGVPTRPGCLTSLLDGMIDATGSLRRRAPTRRAARPTAAPTRPSALRPAGPGRKPAAPALPAVPAVDGVTDGVQDLLDYLLGA